MRLIRAYLPRPLWLVKDRLQAMVIQDPILALLKHSMRLIKACVQAAAEIHKAAALLTLRLALRQTVFLNE